MSKHTATTRDMDTHELKTEQPFFNRIAGLKKTCEVRKLDRDFKVGDKLILKEYNPKDTYYPYSGNQIEVIVTDILTHEQFEGVQPGWCVMSFNQDEMKRNFIYESDPWKTFP